MSDTKYPVEKHSAINQDEELDMDMNMNKSISPSITKEQLHPHQSFMDSNSDTDVDNNSMGMTGNDRVLYEQLRIVNAAIDEIGLTAYHWKLFCLNGMGYATDSLLILLQSLTLKSVQKEFNNDFPASTMALYGGAFLGAVFWGFSADIIGRKFAFNTSLLLSGVFAMITAGMPNLGGYCALIVLTIMGAGGNLILDTTVFLEFLPSSKQWMLTLLAFWWGIGQTVAVLVTWPLIKNYSCPDDAPVCLKKDNMGWRYCWITLGGLVLVLAILRVTVIRLVETPKFNLCEGNIEQVVEDLHKIARDGGKEISLSVEQLEACGRLDEDEAKAPKQRGAWFKQLFEHLHLLYATRKLAISSSLLFLSWTIIGICYPLYTAFLPFFLESRGAELGDGSVDTTYKNLAIANACSVAGPIIAAALLFIPPIPYGKGRKFTVGRRGAMCIGALLSMTFLFAYTAITNNAQNVAFSAVTNVTIFIYFGTLFAFTPEVLPSRCRATGNGIAIACTRIAGIFAPLIAYFGDTSSSVPIYVCAGCFAGLGLICFFYPFEPAETRAM
ncbi:major facilitator superfamily domain-containing protein [Yarrowia lipolytica]|jgi:MFS family permease|uniref:YALI0B18986p n=2 Tax=Yarrowia lipolytica TaxID=4952 RepID=Q6CE31_YARLI|nr:YALI0B18986p [Yarrowia lipolytica CLIB122]AOW01916.1 hypothetical protein YALI1_B24836g [Yarrowia lipolytica]KAB8282502.1 major facilitator superfamily domain-containing protein [Yarrowia lipolytica]KAE8170832.1 major facilitator superfamily domain-containing protein [Yarrowia lipolytica]KAJ8052697.1 major facilitator superfamily domain-containing protein [Yarrowia lipolytica]QNP96865.1 MFS siderochrome iron transporter 1 [Yarrowia lipolytica]|eukprot:XP_501081.1 YALI0B18986p [Yarrowia lipolytica CLIB122]